MKNMMLAMGFLGLLGGSAWAHDGDEKCGCKEKKAVKKDDCKEKFDGKHCEQNKEQFRKRLEERFKEFGCDKDPAKFEELKKRLHERREEFGQKHHEGSSDRNCCCRHREGARPAGDSHAKGGPKGNNGVGNGLDPQPPGNPKVNDGAGTRRGNPGAKVGAGRGKR